MELKNKYYIMRHGQTIYQKENRGINYKADENPFITLTDEGIKMIEKSAGELKEKNVNLIFSSPYLRTKQTAEITAKILGIENIIFDERLIDIDLGIFMGESTEKSTKFYLGEKPSFDNRPENGESWNDILSRVKSFLDEVEKKYDNKNILIVSHADPIWLMVGYLREYKNESIFLEARKDRKNSYPKLAQIIYV